MNYEELSNFEINKAVASIMYPDYEWLPCKGHDSMVIGFDDIENRADQGYRYDYCESPNDAFPIITENRISIFDTGENVYGWAASDNVFKFYSNGDGTHHFDKNPLRAAMIVFLKLHESE